MRCFSSFDHLAVSARIFSSSLHDMSGILNRSERQPTIHGSRCEP
jgi:hypothetical protein